MITVEHLSKVYGSTPAITDVTFSVEPGEILGFLGPNGAGKTTTMRILTGYLPATSGTATVAGFDVHEDSMAVRQRIGYLPETPPLYPDMTVEGFLHFVARLKGVAAGDRPQRVQSSLERCNLVERRDTLIRKLSKGFRQRVGIAQAIVHDPPVIVLDEPTVGLDPRQIIDVRNLIKSLAGDHTIILSTHILPEVSMTCSRVAIINRGRVVATNTPDRLMEDLSGGAGYELEVEGELLVAQERLQYLAGVKSVTTLTVEGLPPHRYKLRVISNPGTDPGRDIAATVIGAGLGLYEMRRVQADLEQVFLELTMADAPADPDPSLSNEPQNQSPSQEEAA
ncbi:ABC transporter ATP-binding protein [Thermoleptolyngbya sichuanensis XZ-Cy5]|uniref:ABC transporter ATP-binding protein n=1 Tax=Thermoleptolyngbya sichuanensis TaxID=2885951 RepID=UPI00240D2CE1|nr:ABC transporter ATP-binding protein [Thermoleptolyngbya sichuanensis]MDG2616883.1 ABC transporter ATP-binding protein [Thermoleptolyngbya sichuanensis XZ-Cy5]